MSIAIIIVCYNSGKMLERCLDSLHKQSRLADQIIVVDNRSADIETLHILNKLAPDQRLQVIRADENLGYGGAINLATVNMDVELVCCLNPDAFPETHWLQALEQAAAAHPNFGSFASLMLKESDNRIIDGAGDTLHISGIPRRRYHGKSLSAVTLNTEAVFSACAGASMYRLSSFKAIGGFDESYFMYVEDIDLGFRLQLAGFPCLLVKDAIVEHIGSATTGEGSDFSIYYGHRNLVYAYLKNMPMLLLLITLPIHLFANLWTILVFLTRGVSKPIFRSKWDALKLIPAALAARRPDRQKVSNNYIWQQLSKLP
jgi:GT2 family glycosyltransferase